MTAFEALARQDIYDKAPTMADVTSTLCEWTTLPNTETFRFQNQDTSITKPKKFIIDFAGYRNSFVHGDTLPWGLIKHSIGENVFDPRQVMSLVIYSLVARLLLAESIWEDAAKEVKVRHDLKDVLRTLHWDTDEPIQESPHVSYVPVP